MGARSDPCSQRPATTTFDVSIFSGPQCVDDEHETLEAAPSGALHSPASHAYDLRPGVQSSRANMAQTCWGNTLPLVASSPNSAYVDSNSYRSLPLGL